MRKIKKEDIEKPFNTEFGESIYEMIGNPIDLGATKNHSLAYVIIPSFKKNQINIIIKILRKHIIFWKETEECL